MDVYGSACIHEYQSHSVYTVWVYTTMFACMNVRGACTNARRCGQLVKLCECEIQGGLIDTKTRAAVRQRPFNPHPYTLNTKALAPNPKP